MADKSNAVATGAVVDAVAGKLKAPKTQVKAVIEALIEETVKNLKKGNKVRLSGFGTFSVRKRKARQGRNPATGQTIKIAASKSVAFKQSSEVKAKL